MWRLFRGPQGIAVNMCSDYRFTPDEGKRDTRRTDPDHPGLPPSVSDMHMHASNAK
jgi:hypothetical protein